MVRQCTSVLYCVMFVLAFLPFSASYLKWQDGKSEEEDNPIAVKMSTKDRLPIPLEAKRRTKRLIDPVSLTASILGIIDFVNKYTKQEKIDETKKYFEEIELQLYEQRAKTNAILQAIQEVSLAVGYSTAENEIMYGLTTLQRHLEHPTDEHLRNDFYKQAKHLPKHLGSLFDGLLGKTNFNMDIIVTLRNLNKCHARKLQEQVESITSFIKAGFAVHVTYQRLRNVSQVTSSSSENTTIQLSFNVTERLEEIMLKCRADETNIKDEIRNIIKEYQSSQDPLFDSNRLNDDIANETLRFLEDKYDTKMWIVIVKKEEVGHSGPFSSLSRGFHTVKEKDTVAAAISINRADANELSAMTQFFLEDFKIPYMDIKLSVRKLLDRMKESTNRYLELMRTRVDTETLFVSSSSKTKIEKCISIVASIGAPYTKFNSLSTNFNQVVFIVAVKTSALFNSTQSALNSLTQNKNNCQQNRNAEHEAEHSGPLRNHGSSLYLSVIDLSKDNGASVIVDRWTNSSSQRWRFVDNQLRNDNGKCLTAWNAENWYIYQYDCHNRWLGQMWYRHGLQIVNGYNLCLSLSETYTDHVVHNFCGSYDKTENWQDFHSSCTEKQITRAAHSYSGLKLIRKEGMMSYVTASENDANDVYMSSWTNDPGQYWRFNDGKLINGYGKCLIFRDDSWFVKQTDCSEIITGHLLTHNEKKQIVNNKGYCLIMGKHSYDHCKDVSEQRWTFEL